MFSCPARVGIPNSLTWSSSKLSVSPTSPGAGAAKWAQTPERKHLCRSSGRRTWPKNPATNENNAKGESGPQIRQNAKNADAAFPRTRPPCPPLGALARPALPPLLLYPALALLCPAMLIAGNETQHSNYYISFSLRV